MLFSKADTGVIGYFSDFLHSLDDDSLMFVFGGREPADFQTASALMNPRQELNQPVLPYRTANNTLTIIQNICSRLMDIVERAEDGESLSERAKVLYTRMQEKNFDPYAVWKPLYDIDVRNLDDLIKPFIPFGVQQINPTVEVGNAPGIGNSELFGSGKVTEDQIAELRQTISNEETVEKTAAKAKHESAGVFIKLPKELAKQFPSLGEHDDSVPHITALFIGKVPKKHEILLEEVIRRVAMEHDPFEIILDDKPTYFPATKHSDGCKVAKMGVISAELKKLHQALKKALVNAEIDVADNFPTYKPHVTLEYMSPPKNKYDGDVPNGSCVVEEVEIWNGDKHTKIPLGRKKKAFISSRARLLDLGIYKYAGKYDHIDFKPPKGVADAAIRGLELRKKNKGKGGLSTQQAKGEGVGSGVQRAVNLKNRSTMSPSTVRRMKAFFDRHQKNKAIDKGKSPSEDKGYIAWLLWGGDAGRAWANKVVEQMEAADKKKAYLSSRVKTSAVSEMSRTGVGVGSKVRMYFRQSMPELAGLQNADLNEQIASWFAAGEPVHRFKLRSGELAEIRKAQNVFFVAVIRGRGDAGARYDIIAVQPAFKTVPENIKKQRMTPGWGVD